MRTISLIYKVFGVGTEKLSNMEPGDSLDLLTDLGNGFNVRNAGDKVYSTTSYVGMSIAKTCRYPGVAYKFLEYF